MTVLRRIALALSLVCCHNAAASVFDQMIDPQDGQLDMSQWILNNAHGFMPVPFLITDPAVGTGGGVALIFFHETQEQKDYRLANPTKQGHIPPSVSGVVAGGTDNGSRLAGVFHAGNWQQDSIRYIGALFSTSFNLKYYPEQRPEPNKFNIEGLFFYQDIDLRIKDSGFFVGANYTFLDTDTQFDLSDNLPGIDPFSLDSQDASLGLKLSYDSLNNKFSPSQGIKAKLETKWHHPNLGGDFDYREINALIFHYQKLNHDWGLALRGDAKAVSDDAPYYAKPFINLRGIPAMRYQAEQTALAEFELSYALAPRWALLGFAGSGKAIAESSNFADSKWRSAAGMGFRYLIANKLGLLTGLDLAKGPEEWALYIQFGTAWR
ncbi:BamA/TamA family outer membrane protein [Motilimonas pumila]|uniref:BamA/TamA family outer membrane protein n=1 Tax=Motilimonas pumila TaxID=2303987 RepID=UPI001E53420C|nr:BamA/TamA family outer membrane protein [Motilimonas pumila]